MFKLKNPFFTVVLSVIFAACANLKTNTNVEQNSEQVKIARPDRIQTDLIDEKVPYCENCIIGSVGDEELKNSDKKIFFLYGAEHLKLTNYYFDIPVVYNAATRKWINYC